MVSKKIHARAPISQAIQFTRQHQRDVKRGIV